MFAYPAINPQLSDLALVSTTQVGDAIRRLRLALEARAPQLVQVSAMKGGAFWRWC